MFESKWLQEQLTRSGSLPPKYHKIDNGKLEEGETVVGEVPLGLRSLWGLITMMRDDLTAALKNHEESHAGLGHGKACAPFRQEALAKNSEIDTLRELFWTSLRHDLKIPSQGIGVRGNFQVVTIEEPELPPGLAGIGIVLSRG